MKQKSFLDISLRYLILVLFAIPNLYIFYKIFTPLTIYPIYFFFKIFFETTLSGTTIFVNNFSIQIINSCVAGSAYYLLFVLNFSVPDIKFSRRIKMISFAFIVFLIVNLIRIIVLSFLSFSNMGLFDITHNITWYMLSVLLVVGIWFVEVKTFKIKAIPFYTDIKKILKLYDN